MSLEIKVTNVLDQIGIPAHIRGYYYIREAIIMAVEDLDVINYITKKLYPIIAAKYNTTPSRVERAIRHAIEKLLIYNEMHNNSFYNSIGFQNDKLTNGQFIATIADKIRIGIL